MSKKRKTPAVNTAPARLMYVGPTLLGGLTQNTVYEELPEVVDKIRRDCPLIVNLFIPIEKYSEANKQIREGKGGYYSAWKSVTAYKAKHA